jgi:hypothetical protein
VSGLTQLSVPDIRVDTYIFIILMLPDRFWNTVTQLLYSYVIGAGMLTWSEMVSGEQTTNVNVTF